MGSLDTDPTDPVLPVQEPGSALAAETKPSDGSGGADGSGASSPSLREQEQVQKFKDKCEVMDRTTGADDNLNNETEALVQEPMIPSVASTRSSCADPTPSNNSGGGDGSGAPWSWSFTAEDHVQNLKKNYIRAYYHPNPEDRLFDFDENDPWFDIVVAKLRANPFFHNSALKYFEGGPHPAVRMNPLLLAVLMGDREMVEMILETLLIQNKDHIDSDFLNERLRSALNLAISIGESNIVDALLERGVKIDGTCCEGSLQKAVLLTRADQRVNFPKIIQMLIDRGIDINSKGLSGYSAFYLAVAKGEIDIVKEFLNYKNHIQLNETCRGGPPPIQIAHEEGFIDIENALMQCEDVHRYIDSAFRDRQAYVDVANAILVGAALIASVTFASWLQPPLNYTTLYHDNSVEYVDVQHNYGLGCFWVFNTLSFYFAIGTVVFGAHSVLPRRQLFIT